MDQRNYNNYGSPDNSGQPYNNPNGYQAQDNYINQNTYNNSMNNGQMNNNNYYNQQPNNGNYYMNNQQGENINNQPNSYYNPQQYDYGFNSQYYQNAAGYNSSQSSTAGYSSAALIELRKERVSSVVTKSFFYMFIVLVISAFSAAWAVSTDTTLGLVSSGGMNFLLIVELVCVMIATAVMNRNNKVMSAIMLFAYSIINGITLSIIFYVFEIGSIVGIFVLASVIFGVMAVFGLCTKKDLTALGTIGFMGLIGVILLGFANMFIRSQSLNMGLAAVGLALFIGITAYDLQKIKMLAVEREDMSDMTLGMYGALIIYLDLINIFIKILILFGKRRD